MVRTVALFVWLCVLAAAAHAQVSSFTKISAVAGVRSLDEGDAFGSAVAPLGDLDGNTDPETVTALAVGVPLNDDGGFNRGAVWILFLDAEGFVEAVQEISDTEGGFTGELNREDSFGHAVVNLGDLDGDGVPDLAVGAPEDDDGNFNSGAVWILFLNTDGTVKKQQKISNKEGGLGEILDPLTTFGSALAGLGDLDGDRVPDLAVGLPLDDDVPQGEGPGQDRGAVRILFLNTDGTVKKQQKISSREGSFSGMLKNRDLFGTSVANLGDLDGDGVTDLGVGAIGDDDGCPDEDGDQMPDDCDKGAVWLLFLNAQGGVKTQQKISDTEGTPDTFALEENDQFGSSVAPLTDLDGDGITEFVAGAAFDDDGDPDSGAAWVLFPDTSGVIKAHQKISSTEGGFTGTLDTDDRLGVSAALLDDIDMDSTTSALVVGANGDDDRGADSGAVWILFLRQDGTVENYQKISAAEGGLSSTLDNGDSFGISVASLGDLDGDDDPETVTAMAVGAIGDDDGFSNAGAVWILFLREDGTVKTRQKISATEGNSKGPLPLRRDDLFSVSLAPLGELDNDNVTDLAVGAFLDDDGGENSGAVWILFLNNDGTVKQFTKISADKEPLRSLLKAGDRFGFSTASLGDLNDNGVTALAVGAVGDDDGCPEDDPNTRDVDESDCNKGAIWILFLDANGTIARQQKISDTQGGFMEMLDPGDGFGRSVAALGDLNGDGVTDLAVGADGDDGEGLNNGGAVWILFLDSNGRVRSQRKITPDATLSGVQEDLEESDGFGRSVASLRTAPDDFDEEIATVLAVGATGDDDGDGGGFDRGAVWFLFLGSDGSIVRQQKISATQGNFAGQINDADRFGISLSNLGDLNNDSVPDLAVGADLTDDGGLDRGAVWILLLNTAPIVHLPDVSPALRVSGVPITISTAIVDNLGVDEAQLHFRRGGVSTFLTSPMTASADSSTFEAIIPEAFSDARGIEYFITAHDEHGFETRFPEAEGAIVPVQIAVRNPGLFMPPPPQGTTENAYRLVTIPLLLEDQQPSAVLIDNLGDYDNTRWRFFDPSGAEFPNVPPMTPGATYWIIVTDAEAIIDTGAGLSVPTGDAFALPLQPGWNYFGHPFLFNLPLSNVATRAGQPLDLWTYNGAWMQLQTAPPDTLKPFNGYAIFNDLSTADTLLIDPDLSSDAAAPALEHTDTSRPGWSIRIVAQSRQARDIETVAAVAPGASERWDRLDRPEPPGVGDYVSAYFTHPEWKKHTARFSTDTRPLPTDGTVWPFEVSTTVRDNVLLTFDGLDDIPPDYEVWLVDDLVQVSQNLRQTDTYTLAGTLKPRPLKLVVGKHLFSDDERAESREIPTRFALFANFPNPFNPATTLRYGVPETARVSLVVYDVLGRQIATLADGDEQAAGYHAVVWDGRNDAGMPVASGLYFARMQAGRFVQTQKMILAK